MTPISAGDAQRAVRFGPSLRRRRHRGRELGGFANAAQWVFYDDATLARELDAIQNTGAGWVRFDFLWTAIEPNNNQWSFARYDKVVAAVRAHGLQILGELDFTPPWARSAACSTSDKCPPGNMSEWQEFITTTVSRYKASVQHWEIWNEPNLSGFWATGPDPAAYTALLQASYPAVKAGDPNGVVVTGGLAPAGVHDADHYPPLDFLKAMYAAGAHGYFDAFGMHPYTTRTRPTSRPATTTSATSACSTTSWWPTGTRTSRCGPPRRAHPGTYVGSDRRRLRGPAGDDCDPHLPDRRHPALDGPGVLVLLPGLRPRSGDIEQNFGILHNDWTPKPAYDAYVMAMQQGL